MNAEIMDFCRIYMRDVPNMQIRQSQMLLLCRMCSGTAISTPAALAADMRVSKAMISSHLNALIGAGLVMRMPSPEDGRSVYVVPTKKGAALVQKFNAANQQKLDLLADKMGSAKFNEFIKLILVANDVLKA